MRRCLTVLLFALLALPAAARADGPLTLYTIRLPDANGGTEPRVTVAPDDSRWVISNGPDGAQTYRSTDGGLSFQRTKADPAQTEATIDTDIVAMNTGRVLASELDDAGLNFPSSFTDDNGGKWTETQGSTKLADQDRQWFAVGPPDKSTGKPTVYLLYHNLGSGTANHNMFVAKSTDGGETFGPPIPTTQPGDTAYLDLQCADSGGPSSIAVNQKTGRIYVVFTTRAGDMGGMDFGGCAAQPLEFNIVNATRVWVATSPDDSPGSWKQSMAVDDSKSGQVVSMQLAYGALDNQGGVYVAYPESPKPYPNLGGAALKVTYQKPGANGELSDGKWLAPRVLVPANPSGDLGVTLVHLAAGDPGKVVLAVYEAKHLAQAKDTPVWYAHVLQSRNLLSDAPQVTDQEVADIPAYKWTASEMMGVCADPTPVQGVENGTACQRSTDVWGIALDAQCRVSITWPAFAAEHGNGIVTGKVNQGPPAGSTSGLPGSQNGTFVTTQTFGPDLCSGTNIPGGAEGAAFTPPASLAQSGCADRLAPLSRVRGRVRATRRGLRLRGTSADRTCRGAKPALRVVRVAIGRRLSGKRCRFLRADGRFAAPAACTRTTYLTAKGKAAWSLAVNAKLPRGRYVVWVRGVDAFGNIEHKAASRNLARFTVH